MIKQMATSAFPSSIRANAILAISLLTYHRQLFDEMVKAQFIDLILNLCKDPNQEIEVRENSTLALVHFALDKRSIKILIEKGVMDLFSSFSQTNNNTNTSSSVMQEEDKNIEKRI